MPEKLHHDYPAPVMYIGVGVPGSGKTTALKEFAADIGAVYVSSDDVRYQLLGDPADQSHTREVWRIVRGQIQRALGQGRDTVLDATAANAEQRRRDVATYREYGAETVVAYWIDTELTETLRRNQQRERVVPEHVIHRMHQDIKNDPPTPADGFDDIIKIG